MSHMLFISDIHLHDHAPQTAAHAFERLEQALPKASQLYLLGDIVNTWLGEDCAESTFEQLVSLLKPYQDNGLTVFFMPGNRDFLFSQKTAQKYQWQYLSDPSTIMLDNQRWILTHGDLLCTDDVSYQRYRKIINMRWLQWLFLKTPQRFRQYIANKIRGHSQQKKHPSSVGQDTTNATCIAQWITQHQAQGMIHGHIHLKKTETFPHYTRHVLPDWDAHRGELLKYQDGTWSWV